MSPKKHFDCTLTNTHYHPKTMFVMDLTATLVRTDPRGQRVWLTIAIALSGAASLILEVVWFRRLGLANEVVAGATGVVSAAFMGGIALGNYLGGRIAERSSNCLWLYAGAETVVGVSAIFASRSLEPLGLNESIITWLGSDLVLLIPTTAMGMGLPLLAKTFSDQRKYDGRIVAFLCGANTTGAGIGVAWVGFVGIPLLSSDTISLIAILLQFSVAVIVACVALLTRTHPPPIHHSRVIIGAGSAHRGALVASGLASCTAMWVQVIWVKCAASWTGAPGQSFSTTVLAYLIGFATGGFLAMALLARFKSVEKTTSVMLAFAALSLGFAVLLTEIWHPSTKITVLTAMLPILPMTAAGGTLFPLFIACSLKNGAAVGIAVGTTGAASTLGAIMGALCGAALASNVDGVFSLLGSIAAYGALATTFCFLRVPDS